MLGRITSEWLNIETYKATFILSYFFFFFLMEVLYGQGKNPTVYKVPLVTFIPSAISSLQSIIFGIFSSNTSV